MIFKDSYQKVLDDTKNSPIVIVGAGVYGRELLGALIDDSRDIECLFDNNVKMEGLLVYGYPIKKPSRIEVSSAKYVIGVADEITRHDLKEQLIYLGIKEQDILSYYPNNCGDYRATLRPDEYKACLDKMYKAEFDKEMNWKAPETYNEKINWEKLNLQDERRSRLADKLLVREWVANRIGKEHLTTQYGMWDDPEKIDFEKLPDKFVLKANNGSARNILITDRRAIKEKDIKGRLSYWLSSNYMYECFEMHYANIKPMIIAEEYLDGMAETLYDYNIFCFHGEPKYVWCIKGSHRPGCTASFYDLDWNMQPFSYGYPLDVFPAPKPERLEEMLDLTRSLCDGFDHVRVDWYILPNREILFGEMTFQTWGGLKRFVPAKYDAVFGALI